MQVCPNIPASTAKYKRTKNCWMEGDVKRCDGNMGVYVADMKAPEREMG